MQKNFHIGKFFGHKRRRSLRLAITTRTIGVERSFLLWAPGVCHVTRMITELDNRMLHYTLWYIFMSSIKLFNH